MVFTALSGKYSGMHEVTSGLWKLYYSHVELGYFEERSKTVYAIEDLETE